MVQSSPAALLIDRLEELILNSPKIPFSTKVMIDEERFFELLDRLREDLPTELAEAERIMQHQQAILAEAQSKAEKMIELTKEKARQAVEQSELVRQAQQMAEQVRQATERELRQQRYETDKYSEEVLASLEEKVSQALVIVQSGRSNLARNMQASQPDA